MLSILLLGAVAALRAPGRGSPAGSLPKPHQRSRNFDTAEIFVANLPDGSDRNEFLRFARSAFPAVRRVTLPRDRSTGAARGFVRDPCPLSRFNGLFAALRRPPNTSPRDRTRTMVSRRRSSRSRATTCPRPSRRSTARCWARSGSRRGRPTSAPPPRPTAPTGAPTP